MLTTTAGYKTAIVTHRTDRITGTITLTDGTSIYITDDNIIQNSLYIDEQVVSGDDLDIGSVVASQLGLKLEIPASGFYSLDGLPVFLDSEIVLDSGEELSANILTSATIELDYGLLVGAAYEDIPLGLFIIYEAKRVTNYIDIVALDYMTLLDGLDSNSASGTPEEQISMAIVSANLSANCTVHAASATTDTLNIDLLEAYAGAILVNLATHDGDTLAVSESPAGTILIELANTTASKNTAVLIEAAIQALGTVGGISVATAICADGGNWDTAAIATGETGAVGFSEGLVTSPTTLDTYPNFDLNVNYPTTSSVKTLRDRVMWACSLNATYARMNRYGQLEVLLLYKASPDRTIAAYERYDNTFVSDNEVKVTELIMDINGEYHDVGSAGLTMELPENQFLKTQTSAAIDTALTAILTEITKVEYYPFEFEFIGDPSLQPGDWITIADTGNVVDDPVCLITHSLWRFDGRHILRGVGKVSDYVKPISQTTKEIAAVRGDLYTNYSAIRATGTSTAYDPASVAAGGTLQFTITATDAALGDFVIAYSTISTGAMVVTANVTAADTVTVTLFNPTVGAIDLGASDWKATVFKG